MSRGDVIKKRRLEKGISQKELAERLGLSPQNIAQWETGKRNPKIQTLEKIAAALEIPITDLLPEQMAYISQDDYEMIHLLRPDLNITEILQNIPPDPSPGENQYKSQLLEHFNSLNDTGQEKAVEQVELLTKIPEYKKKKDPLQ